MNLKKSNDVLKQLLGITPASSKTRFIVFFLGLFIISWGLTIKINFGLLLLYLILASVLSIAQYKKFPKMIGLILMASIVILAIDAKFYELLYLFGTLLVGYSLVMDLKD
jgi:chromate transport protein ChrA